VRFAFAAQLVRGFCMGAADLVPGVSGGTVALLFGIYEPLITNVRMGALVLFAFIRFDVAAAYAHLRRIEWPFVLPLAVGIGGAVLSLSHLMSRLLDDYPVETSAVFFGLVAASIIVAWDRLKSPRTYHFATFGLSAAATYWLLGFRGENVTDPALWFVLLAGALAICAMILPGISGSFILVMLGMYDHVLDALNDRDILTLAVFSVGLVSGISLFSSVLSWVLRRYHDLVLAILIGLMLGSLRVLWPWPDGTEGAKVEMPPIGDLFIPVGLAAAAAIAVIGLTHLGDRPVTRRTR
jgi:putative membrane protein